MTGVAEWLIERGIGETRAILVEHGAIVAARVCWGEAWRAGAVTPARLDHRHPGTRRGAVILPDGAVVHVDALPPGLTVGARLMVRITRAALAETGRFKLAQCRAAGDVAPCAAPDLADAPGDSPVDSPVRVLDRFDRAFDALGWDDVLEAASTGLIDLAGGGRLTISPTPAMTLIDIDGPPPLDRLAHAAVPAIAGAIGRLDLAGSIAIDFPGLADRAARHAVDAALDEALAKAGWRGERTAMNGFGLVQLVSRLARPSLLARHAHDPARAAAFALLRRAEHVGDPGDLLLVAHPAVLAAITPDHAAELARRAGRRVRREAQPGLALRAGFAQAMLP